MEDMTLLPLKLGIYAVMALFALGAAWTLRTRSPLPTSYRLPHGICATNLIGIPTLFWALGAMATLARPYASLGHVHMEAVITLCVMAVTMIGLVAIVSARELAMRSFVLYHTLIWGGLISGVAMIEPQLSHTPKITGFALCSMMVCGLFTSILSTRVRTRTTRSRLDA